MEEIKIGEYVRTKSGFIGKVIGRHGGYGLHYELDVDKEIQKNLMNKIIHENNILKHSKHIIDLIECGDYVNHCYVLHTAEEIPREQVNGKSRKCISINTNRDINNKFGWKLLDLEIREILTKEQYIQNCYIVEREEE